MPDPKAQPGIDLPAGRARAWPGKARDCIRMLGVGTIIGIDNLAFSIAIATLLFTGPLAAGLELAVSAALVGTLIGGTVLALFSRITCHIGHVQDLGVAVLAQALSVTVASQALPEEARIATALVIVALASLASALVLMVTGWFGWGRIARYFPQTVLAGFLAGSGWLLTIGGLSVASGVAMADLVRPAAWSADSLRLALPAVLFAALLWVVLRRVTWSGALVAVLALAVLGFHLVLWLSGLPLAQAQAQGWLPRADAGGAALPNLAAIAPLADWQAVALALPAILTVAFLTLMGALMSTSALEAVTGEEADANRELRLTGLANLMIAGVAGPPAFSGFVSSLMAIRAGITTQGTGLVMAAVVLAGLVAAGAIIATIPVFVMAGLILYLGVDLMVDWLGRTRRTYGPGEWLVVAAIVATVVLFGFVAGILAGLVIACVIFVWSYAEVPILRRSGSLRDVSSTLTRGPAEAEILHREGERVAVVELQGYLFFGTAERLYKVVRNRLAAPDRPPLLRLILDLHHVVGLDAAAAAVLARISGLVAQQGGEVILSGCRAGLAAAIARAAPGLRASLVPVLDEALEQAEDAVLSQFPVAEVFPGAILRALTPETRDLARLEPLFGSLPREHLPQGSIVLRAGEQADSLVFLETGRVEVRAPSSDAHGPRLRAMAAGAVLGDIGLALGTRRTADVVAATDITLRRLTRQHLARIEQEDPQLALAVQRLLARALAERIVRDERMTLGRA